MHESPRVLSRLGLIGAGAAGSGILRAMTDKGVLDLAWIVDPGRIGQSLSGLSIWDRLPAKIDVDLLLLAVPEESLPALVQALCQRLGAQSGPAPMVGQLSASSPLALLDPLRKLGVSAGLLHPLQTFPRGGAPPASIPFWAVGGDATFCDSLTPLLQQLDAEWLRLDPEQQIPYHLCGVLASNFLPVLLHLCGELWPGPPQQALKALRPIMAQTLTNLERTGLAGAISGPVARKDRITVARHLAWLQEHRPDLLPLYSRLSEEILTLREPERLGEALSLAIWLEEQEPMKSGDK